MNTRNNFTLFFLIPAILMSLNILPLSESRAQTIQTVAVLPFTIHADKNMDFVKQGISRMFYSRISWPDKVAVIPPEKMKKVQAELTILSESKRIKAVAQKTSSQYILSGSITQFDGSFSIDAKIFDIENKRYMAFSEQSDNSDHLINKVDRIAAAINQRIFERTTVTWEEMEQEKQKDLNDLKRKNPEHLMPVPQNWQPEEKIGWKVWKYLF